jgi:hypothetical protein
MALTMSLIVARTVPGADNGWEKGFSTGESRYYRKNRRYT